MTNTQELRFTLLQLATATIPACADPTAQACLVVEAAKLFEKFINEGEVKED